VDPVSTLLALWLVVYLIRVVAQDVTSGTGLGAGHQHRVARLATAGYTPTSSGGPTRRYLSAAWRSAWMDAAARAARRRARQAEREATWWQRRAAQAQERATARWRTPITATASTGTSTSSTWPPHPPPTSTNAGQNAAREPIRYTATAGPRRPQPSEPTHDYPRPSLTAPDLVVVAVAVPDPATPPGAGTATAVAPAPTRQLPVQPIPQGSLPPHPAQQTIEGEVMGAVVPAGAVTGVVTGANAARGLAHRLEAAVAAYQAELATIRAGIHLLNEQTRYVVQLAGYSDVIAALEFAADVVATAQRDAGTVGELTVGLYATAAAYDRLNS
jgi:hypothetical protein